MSSASPPGPDGVVALTFVLFFGSAAAIYFACEFFVNGVEWVGHRLKVTRTATGSVLAAFGTALPESVVTFVAVAFGHGTAERDIGIGAALGGPLALSTLAYGVVGLTLMGSRALGVRRKKAVDADARRLSRDQAWFLVIFVVNLALGLTVFPGKRWFGLVLIAAYGFYVWNELRDEGSIGHAHELTALAIRPRDPHPALGWAVLQTLAALAVIFVASRLFVMQLNHIGPWLGLPPQLVALLLSPIATEMPETMNAIIWVRQGKEGMALANISGAMMIQATIPAACGLLGTPWLFGRPLAIAAFITVLAVIFLLLMFRGRAVTGRRLAMTALLYLVFAAALAVFG